MFNVGKTLTLQHFEPLAVYMLIKLNPCRSISSVSLACEIPHKGRQAESRWLMTRGEGWLLQV
jgi:hypothetical protein